MPKDSNKSFCTRVIMMPKDTNGHGKIFGGVLLSQIDIAGAVAARTICSNGLINRIVTRAMDKIEFTKPVLVNDSLSCYGKLIGVGNTSIRVHVDVEVERHGVVIPVTEAEVTYVAIDESGRPTPLTCLNNLNVKNPRQSKLPVNITRNEKPAIAGSKLVKNRKRVIALQKAMMPFELNGMGNIFGGVLLGDMDLAGFYVATHACTNPQVATCVTRAMNRVEFTQPVHVNDLITCYGTVVAIGETAVTILVEVEATRPGKVIPVTKAEVTYVALDVSGQPTPILRTRRNKR